MRRIFLTLITMAVSVILYAVPAKRTEKTFTLTDGTQVQAALQGDEGHHWLETSDGKLLKAVGNGRYAYSNQTAVQARQKQQNRINARAITRRHRTIGERNLAPRGLVLLVNFSDQKYVVPNANTAFTNMLNQSGYSANGGTGSARDYFRTSSMGVYEPTFQVYGPYTLPHTMDYYGANETYYDEYGEEQEDDVNPVEMIVDACKLADADGVDFSLYDNNNDGVLDFVFVFYAGYNEAEYGPENSVWPHQWEVYDSETNPGEGNYNYDGTVKSITFDGKRLFSYACTSELKGSEGSDMAGVGTFCHEFGHVLGLPDMYATDYATHKTLGEWDIMDYGSYNNDGCTPPVYSAYERMFMGWMTPVVLTEAGTDTLRAISTSNEAFLISSTGKHNMDGLSPNPKEYYLLENRQQVGWDTYLPGHGMLVTHIRYNSSRWENNEVNNTSSSQGIDIVEADGKTPSSNQYDDGYYGKQGDVFPTSSRTSWSPYAKYPLTNIKETGDLIVFDFMTSSSSGSISGNCFEETFDKFTTAANTDITSKLDNYTDNAGWTGVKIFSNNGEVKAGSSKQAGSLTTPAVGVSGDVTLTFNARQYSSDNNKLNLSIQGGGRLSVSSVSLNASGDNYTVSIIGCTEDSKITFSASKRFYIDNVSLCAVSTGLNDNLSDAVRISTSEGKLFLSGLAERSSVQIYSMIGRMLYNGIVDNNLELSLAHGIYVVVINQSSYKVAL
ncbi:MAG: M6 family metalloprotease domain-containing protein [Paludibacteraceae bacterium]|nr:M6 family metalloprotease domain-containing protein [Paludibacteraceae bacterium]